MGEWIIHKEIGTVKSTFGVKQPKRSFLGYVYAIEYGDYLKIGSTSNPYVRMNNLASSAKNYGKLPVGRMLISPPHTNYRENEKALHKKFKPFHHRAELFNLYLDESVEEIVQIVLLDETERLARESEETASMFIGFIKGENTLMKRSPKP